MRIIHWISKYPFKQRLAAAGILEVSALSPLVFIVKREWAQLSTCSFMLPTCRSCLYYLSNCLVSFIFFLWVLKPLFSNFWKLFGKEGIKGGELFVLVLLAYQYPNKIGLLPMLIKKSLVLHWIKKYSPSSGLPSFPHCIPPVHLPTTHSSIHPFLSIFSHPPSFIKCMFIESIFCIRHSLRHWVYLMNKAKKSLPSWRSLHPSARRLFPQIGHSFVNIP